MNPSPPTHQHSISSEFMLLITVIIIPFMLIIGWQTFEHMKHNTQQQYLQSLRSLAEEKVNTINQHLDDHADRVETLSMMPLTHLAIPALSSAFHQKGIDSSAYHQANVDYADFFKLYLSQWKYYDLFLIDPQGDIIYSVTHESDFTTNLQTGPYRDTGLGKVFKQSINFLQTNNSTFAYYEPSKKAAAFVATPVMHQGKLLGVVALQFNTDAFYDVANNLAGLGEYGEIMMGTKHRDHILITIPLRHDPDAAFKRKIPLDAPFARPIRESSQGGTGSGVIVDWRGEQSLAVWQYIPALKWGMVVKVDYQESFSYSQQMQRTLITYVIIGLLITYLLITMFTRRITRPLRKLTQASRDVSAGMQDIPLDALFRHQNEVGTLASAFDAMVQQVHASQGELEQTIDTLAETNRTLDQQVIAQTERIRAVIEHAEDGIITMDPQGIITSINPAISHIFG
ncbi:MAG: HAMP domain-containing protein, partial [Ghiorsea sp.]